MDNVKVVRDVIDGEEVFYYGAAAHQLRGGLSRGVAA